jgi:3-methyl-2-oxobutanoate hydroxymethyltransferase
MECVPAKVAEEITKRTKMLVFSMGSGANCDGQFLFASDLLGTNTGHYPRHSITYTRFFDAAVDAFKRYKDDIVSGAYPAQKHVIGMKDDQFERFLKEVES